MLSRPSPTPDAQATVNPFTHLLPHLLPLVSLSDLLGLTWNSLQIWLDLESSSNKATTAPIWVCLWGHFREGSHEGETSTLNACWHHHTGCSLRQEEEKQTWQGAYIPCSLLLVHNDKNCSTVLRHTHPYPDGLNLEKLHIKTIFPPMCSDFLWSIKWKRDNTENQDHHYT